MSSSPLASVLSLPLEPPTSSANDTSNSLEQQVSAIPNTHEPNKFPQKRSFGFNLPHVAKVVRTHFLKHVGAGLVASVAYFDPGNWSVDLQAGSEYGYKMLFVVLLAGIIAVILQVRGYHLQVNYQMQRSLSVLWAFTPSSLFRH
jgi:hypothetical protein